MANRKPEHYDNDEEGEPLHGMPQHGFPKTGKGKPPVGWMVSAVLASGAVAVVVVVRSKLSRVGFTALRSSAASSTRLLPHTGTCGCSSSYP
jgi:hypothetical protein